MIGLLSDIHGQDRVLARAIARAKAAGCVALVQLGDFGIWPDTIERLIAVVRDGGLPVYFIDGNHEHFGLLNSWAERPLAVTKGLVHISPLLTYVERGTVLDLDGLRLGCLGGAGSIDYRSRTLGRDWFLEEQVGHADVGRLIFNTRRAAIDVLLTHTPPQHIIRKHLSSPLDLVEKVRAFGVSTDWTDPSADRVEEAWRAVGCPPLVCGHLHLEIFDADEGGPIRVLRADDLITISKEDLMMTSASGVRWALTIGDVR